MSGHFGWFIAFTCFISASVGQFHHLFTGVAHLHDYTFYGSTHWTSEDASWRALAFRGIKYANSKRFEPSTVNFEHMYLRNLSHPQSGYSCPQTQNEYSGTAPLIVNEDCLYLDVYLPPIYRQHSRLSWQKFPVLVWVHGGNFDSGNKDMFPAGELARSIGAIVVVPNYRLGVFGFLSTQSADAAGNWALFDLKLAIKWVHDNIHHFGGDSSRVTLGGERAGAVMTSILLTDETVQNALHGAITFSGNMFTPGAIQKNALEITSRLAERLNCPNESVAVIRCLKNASAEELLFGASSVRSRDPLSLLPIWAPVVDGINVQFDPSWVLDMPGWKWKGGYVTGYSTRDAAWPLLMKVPRVYGHGMVDKEWLLSTFIPSIIESVAECPPSESTLRSLSHDLYYKYDLGAINGHKELNHQIIRMVTDVFYATPGIVESYLQAKQAIPKLGNQHFVIQSEDSFDDGLLMFAPEALHLFGSINSTSVSSQHVNEAVSRELRRLVGHAVRHGYGFGKQFDEKGGHRIVLGPRHEWRSVNGMNVEEIVQNWLRIRKAAC